MKITRLLTDGPYVVRRRPHASRGPGARLDDPPDLVEVEVERPDRVSTHEAPRSSHGAGSCSGCRSTTTSKPGAGACAARLGGHLLEVLGAVQADDEEAVVLRGPAQGCPVAEPPASQIGTAGAGRKRTSRAV